MARKYNFAAEVLLKLRKRCERSARRDCREGMSDIVAVEGRLARLRNAARMHHEALQRMESNEADTMNMHLYRQCIGDIDRAIVIENRRLATAQAKLENRKTELHHAVTQRKTLGMLKDRLVERHGRVEARREAAEWDQEHLLHQAERADG